METWISTVLAVWRRGQQLGAVGPGEVEHHLEHSRRLAEQLDPPGNAVDLGSGAGIPGLALAGLWPDSSWLLVDAAARRVRLLQRAIDELGWTDRVVAVHGRAEELARDPAWDGWADLVTARSFGPPAAVAECGVRFLRRGGLMVVAEPPAPVVDRWSVAGLATLGLDVEPERPDEAVRIKRLRRTRAVPARFPRRAGVPARRPLFSPGADG